MSTGPLSHPKILSLPEYLAVAASRTLGTVVFTNGCFDLLHAGHVDLLRRARTFGNVLVLGLNNDASVSRLKCPARPVTPLAERAFVLSALECVDFILPFEEDTPLELIRAVRPDVLVKGGDWTRETIVGAADVESWGGRVLSLDLLPGHSTTAIIRRIRGLPLPD